MLASFGNVIPTSALFFCLQIRSVDLSKRVQKLDVGH